MATSRTAHSSPTTSTIDRSRNTVYSAVIGLCTLAILLQALWAGLFVHEGKDYQENWVEVHGIGADTAIALAAIASVVAIVKLRSRRDLIIGTIALAVLLVLEAFLGGLIGDHGALTAVHFPLAMALLALAIWLPLRSRHSVSTAGARS